MEENEFWIAFWKVVGAVLCVLVLTAAGCQMHTKQVIQGMVEKGVDPMVAACGVNESSASAMCIGIAVRGQTPKP